MEHFLHASGHVTKPACHWELVNGPNLYRNKVQVADKQLPFTSKHCLYMCSTVIQATVYKSNHGI